MLIGKKIGMTRLFDESGMDQPVTILEAGPCTVTQIKTPEKDGYSAIKVGFGEVKSSKVSKSLAGQKSTSRWMKEFPLSNEEIEIGSKLSVDVFSEGELVDIEGKSKGKGFAGHMKRHGFSGGRKSHGKNSVMRKAGSVGAGADPSKIWKGVRMAGRMGYDRVTVKNLEVVKIDADNNQLFIKGAVPGPRNGIVYIKK